MKKSTKGAVATAAAGALLLGGAGSLAYWTDGADVTGGTITSGTLALTGDNCGSWTLDGGGAGSDFGSDGTGGLIVPGDSLTKVCTYDIAATGNHLKADLSVGATSWGTSDPDLKAALMETPVTATYEVGGVVKPQITTADAGAGKLVATIKVDFPYDGTGADAPVNNATKGKTAILNAITVTAKQIHNP